MFVVGNHTACWHFSTKGEAIKNLYKVTKKLSWTHSNHIPIMRNAWVCTGIAHGIIDALTSQTTVLILIVPRAWDIGFTHPCIKCRMKSATHFLYFWSRKTLPYTHLEATSYIPQQVKALSSEPLPYLLQAVTKISTLYNFYEWRV